MAEHRGSRGTVAFVGNAPRAEDIAAEVDAADEVVRFNNAYGCGGRTGAKITTLFLVNCGGQMREWLSDPLFGTQPHVRAAQRIVLPISPDTARYYPPSDVAGTDGMNYACDAKAVLERAGKSVDILPATAFRLACEALDLGPFRPGMPSPSTGFLALHAYWHLRPAPERIALYGFDFDGWPGHPWQRERDWVSARERSGRLIWHR